MECGLNQTCETCDNGPCKIYNLDMPDAIDIRNYLFPTTELVKNIGCDLNGSAWFAEIDLSRGVLLL